jgi:hypothetical protein
MIGIAGERFPKGGALTLNMITGVGMIGVGIVGAVYLGYIQDTEIDSKIMEYDKDKNTALHSEYVTIEKKSIFGKYLSLDSEKLATAPEEDQQTVNNVQLKAQKSALKMVAVLPVVMLVCFIFLFFYFRARGGYKSIVLTEGDT